MCTTGVLGGTQVIPFIFSASDVVNVLCGNRNEGEVQSVGVVLGHFAACALGQVFTVQHVDRCLDRILLPASFSSGSLVCSRCVFLCLHYRMERPSLLEAFPTETLSIWTFSKKKRTPENHMFSGVLFSFL